MRLGRPGLLCTGRRHTRQGVYIAGYHRRPQPPYNGSTGRLRQGHPVPPHLGALAGTGRFRGRKEGMMCDWFALCDLEAIGTVLHPVLGDVPVCERCAKQLDLELRRYEELECLDRHKGGCNGAVEYRPSLTGTGMAIPRCDAHWEERLEWQEQHLQVYPDSSTPPAWFDPLAAGERWDDDY